MAQIGRPLDPWQAAITLDAFGVRSDGLWSAFELLIALARQNGKGGATEAIELGGLFLFREPLIMHSAHQFKTSTAAFRRLQEIIDASDWLRRRVKMISRSKGDESIELTKAAGGGRLQFVARTLGSGRGLTGSKNIFDEAAWLTIGQYAAQTPTLSTIPNPQIIYTSTPPDEDVGPMPEDAMLPSVRRRGLAGDDRVAMYEWSPPKKFDRTDPNVWYDCNPALGIRISEWFLAKQLRNFTEAGKPEKFDTEHLGVWPVDGVEQWLTITEDQWAEATDADVAIVDPVAMALDVPPDRSSACIAMAGAVGEDVGMEVIDQRTGTGWVPARVVELVRRWKPCRVVIDVGGAAGALVPDIEAALKKAGLKVEIVAPGARGVADAYGLVYDALTGKAPEDDAPSVRKLWHRGDPRLTAAVAGATTRKVGAEGTSWDRRDTAVDISPLVAATNAVWGYVTRPLPAAAAPMFAFA